MVVGGVCCGFNEDDGVVNVLYLGLSLAYGVFLLCSPITAFCSFRNDFFWNFHFLRWTINRIVHQLETILLLLDSICPSCNLNFEFLTLLACFYIFSFTSY